jgi:predicted nucleotidyltransferase component of viral defense system
VTSGPKDIASSIRARLSNYAQAQGRPFQEVLQYFAIERFLHRLAASPHGENFVLKGGIVFFAWGVPLRRPTRDIDLHGKGTNAVEDLEAIVRDICQQDVEPDGMRFDPNSVRGQVIQSQAEYDGVRLRFKGYLGAAKAHMQLDVGFSDTLVPPAITVDFPTLLSMPAPRLRAYAYETLIAEKLQAMVFLGSINSRIKDFYDIWLLAQEATISGEDLQQAIRTTFDNRGTAIPTDTPLPLSDSFAEERNRAWSAFLAQSDVHDVPDFVRVVADLRAFLLPVLEAINNSADFTAAWKPEKQWTFT